MNKMLRRLISTYVFAGAMLFMFLDASLVLFRVIQNKHFHITQFICLYSCFQYCFDYFFIHNNQDTKCDGENFRTLEMVMSVLVASNLRLNAVF